MTNSIKSTEVAGYIVRSKRNVALILTESGDFVYEGCLGPGGLNAKIYKTERNALKVRSGNVTAHPVNAAGIEIAWLRANGHA